MATEKHKLPIISSAAYRLFLICIAIITAYLICTAAYIWQSGNTLTSKESADWLHSTLSAALIALGGSLLFDCEMKYDKKGK